MAEPFGGLHVFFSHQHYFSSYSKIYLVIFLSINRPVKGICGFSRETVIAVTTNIESMELRSASIGYEEHPGAGTSDDVEGFIALFDRFLGAIFTVKELRALWPTLVKIFKGSLRILKDLHGDLHEDLNKDLQGS